MTQAKSDREISQLLVAQGLLTQNQLTQALEYQCRLPPGQYVSLPQILIDFEFVTEAQIRSALGERYDAFEDPIGQILIQEGIISSAQLQQAMEILNAFPTQHIVDILVDLGLISKKQLEQAISSYQLKQSKSFVKTDSRQKGLQPLQQVHQDTHISDTDYNQPLHLPLGRILIAKGVLSQEDLEHALEYQRRLPKVMHKPLGEILIDLGYITTEELASALAEQPTKPQNRIGEQLVQAGVINQGQLAHALSLQFSPEHAHKKLGQLLVELGYTTREAIEAVFRKGNTVPASTATPAPAPQPLASPQKPLGQILLEKGYITPQQLDQALSLQRQESGKDYRPLGDILVLTGSITEAQLQECLADQTGFKQEPIGQILIRHGLISDWQLAHALCVQFEPGPHKNLGAILVELGYSSQEAIEAVMIQYTRSQKQA